MNVNAPLTFNLSLFKMPEQRTIFQSVTCFLWHGIGTTVKSNTKEESIAKNFSRKLSMHFLHPSLNLIRAKIPKGDHS